MELKYELIYHLWWSVFVMCVCVCGTGNGQSMWKIYEWSDFWQEKCSTEWQAEKLKVTNHRNTKGFDFQTNQGTVLRMSWETCYLMNTSNSFHRTVNQVLPTNQIATAGLEVMSFQFGRRCFATELRVFQGSGQGTSSKDWGVEHSGTAVVPGLIGLFARPVLK